MEEKKLENIWRLSIIIYGGTLAYSFCQNAAEQDWKGVGMGVVALLTPCIVPLLFRLFHWKKVYEILLLSNGFTYFASVWGGTLDGYSLLGFDKVLHFSSGWLLTTAAVLLYFAIRKSNRFNSRQEYLIFLIFINAVNMAAAQLWEFFEYAMLVFFGNDCINHYTQGVHDSMTDMLCAAVAGLLLTGFFVRYYKTGKACFFVKIYEKFYKRNLELEKDGDSDYNQL